MTKIETEEKRLARKAREAAELERRRKLMGKTRPKGYLLYLLVVLSIVYIVDEVTSAIGTSMQSEVVTEFFVLGKNAEQYPDLYQRILDEGHKIGNHTYSHQKGWGMSLERYIEDVDLAAGLLQTELFRPPYARVTPSQMRAVGQRYKIIMWNILSRDYSPTVSPTECAKGVLKHIAPGAIIAFHDSDKSFRNMSYALPRVLERAKELGLKCKIIEL